MWHEGFAEDIIRPKHLFLGRRLLRAGISNVTRYYITLREEKENTVIPMPNLDSILCVSSSPYYPILQSILVFNEPATFL